MALPESEFFARAAALLAAGERFTVCRVIGAVGSAPRNAGAQMLVLPAGGIAFTLGGGAVEGRVIREAALAGPRAPARIREYRLGELGMHCGGIMRVAYEEAHPADLPFYRRASELVRARAPFVAAYGLVEGAQAPLPKALFPQAGEPWGPEDFLRRAREPVQALWAGQARSVETAGLFAHLVLPPLRLLVFGGGHVGAKLAEVAHASGVFLVEIVDDRPEFADPARLAFADAVRCVPENYRQDLPLPDARTFVAVITRCHATDKVVVQSLLASGRPFAYLGMIGSVPKRAKLFKLLRDEGIPQEKLEKVSSPMGLPIGGKAPGEIALSVLAEMVQRKNELDGTLEGGIIRWKRRQGAQTQR